MVLSRGGGEVAPRPAVCLRPQLPGLPGRLTGPEAPGPARLLRSAGTRRGCRAPQPERKRAALQDSGCWGPQPLPGAPYGGHRLVSPAPQVECRTGMQAMDTPPKAQERKRMQSRRRPHTRLLRCEHSQPRTESNVHVEEERLTALPMKTGGDQNPRTPWTPSRGPVLWSAPAASVQLWGASLPRGSLGRTSLPQPGLGRGG